MTNTERLKIVEKARRHAIWIATEVFPEDRTRALDQAYGFIQGLIFVYGEDRALINLLTDTWLKVGNAIRFNDFKEFVEEGEG